MVKTVLAPLCSYVLLVSACTAASGDAGEDGSPDAGEEDGSPDAPPPTLRIANSYSIDTTLSLSAANAIPQSTYDALLLLESWATSPGATMLDLAEQAGVPAVGTLRDALPSSLESRLVGWIDDAIDNDRVDALIGQLSALARAPLAALHIESNLDTAASTQHNLTALAFDTDAQRHRLPLGSSALTQATPSISVAGNTVSIGAHSYGLPFGTLMWEAVESAAQQRYGTTVTQSLADAVGCPSIATEVAGQCVLSLCVGHRAELEQICTAAVGAAVDRLREEFTALDMDLLSYATGTATLSSPDANGVATRIAGEWDAQVDVSSGLRDVPATFDGTAP